MHHTNQTQNVKFDSFDLVTLDNLYLTQGHKRLRMAIRSIPDTAHVVPSTFISLWHGTGEISKDR